MKRFVRRLWSRRWIRICAWCVLALLVVLIVLRQTISWRGARRWADVQASLAREGESLDFRENAPEPIPDDQNFFAIPALKNFVLISDYGDATGEDGARMKRFLEATEAIYASKNRLHPASLRSPGYGGRLDLSAWAQWFSEPNDRQRLPVKTAEIKDPASYVLSALSASDPLVAELAEGLNRPGSQQTPAWKIRNQAEQAEGTLPYSHYGTLVRLRDTLTLRGVAAARAGDERKAAESLLILLRLHESFVDEPNSTGTVLACDLSTTVCGTVWELCDARLSSENDFKTVQEELTRVDLRKAMLNGARGELREQLGQLAEVRKTRDFRNYQSPVTKVMLRFIPDGFFDSASAIMTQWQYDYLISALKDSGLKAALVKQDAMRGFLLARTEKLEKLTNLNLDELPAVLMMWLMNKILVRVIYAQCVINEAIAACALERYRIDHGQYPDSLEAADRVGERAIPLDLISGTPMHYRKTPNGRYALWCVGIDGKDDGGKRVLNEKEPERTKFNRREYVGDWVWDFPDEPESGN